MGRTSRTSRAPEIDRLQVRNALSWLKDCVVWPIGIGMACGFVKGAVTKNPPTAEEIITYTAASATFFTIKRIKNR